MHISNVVSDMDDDECYELDMVQIFWRLRGKSNHGQPPIQILLIESFFHSVFWKISEMSYGVQASNMC